MSKGQRRIRTIKPEFCESESMGRVSHGARLLFLQLFTLVDDEGRARGNPKFLSGALYPYDGDVSGDVEKWLDELAAEGCIVRYEYERALYLAIRQWTKHQKINRPSASQLPPPPESSGVLAEFSEGSVNAPEDSSPPLDSSVLDLGPTTNYQEPPLTPPGGKRNGKQPAWQPVEDWCASRFGAPAVYLRSGRVNAATGKLIGAVGPPAGDDPLRAVQLLTQWERAERGSEQWRFVTVRNAHERFAKWHADHGKGVDYT